VIKANAKNGENNPIFTIKQGGKNIYAHNVKVVGEMELVYSPDKPLSCGAKVWIETRGDVKVDGKILSAYALNNSVLTKVNPTTSLAMNLDKSLKEFLSKKRRKVQNKNKLSACLSR
jgi:hypothetical protein